MLFRILLSLCLFTSAPVVAQKAQEHAEADFLFARHSFVSWDSAALGQYTQLRNSRVLNSVISGASIQPYVYPAGTSVHTAKAMTLGISSAQGEGLISAGPSRINFSLGYISDDPHVASMSTAQQTAFSSSFGTTLLRQSTLDLEPPAELRHYSLNYDHELYFAPATSSLYGLGLWYGLSADYDRLKIGGLKLGQTLTVSSSIALGYPSFYLRDTVSQVFSAPALVGVAYRSSLTDRLLLDVRAAYINVGYGESKLKSKDDVLTVLSIGTSTLPYPGKGKSETKIELGGSGYRINAGLTYRLSEGFGLRLHGEDRLVRLKFKSFSVSPDQSALSTSFAAGFSGGSSATAALVGALLPDLGPLPSGIVDRRRAVGLEFQYWY